MPFKETERGQTHWHGCYKEHVECANDAIQEAYELFIYLKTTQHELSIYAHGNIDMWLERWFGNDKAREANRGK